MHAPMDALVVFDLRHESQRRHINADEERLTGAKSGSGRETEPLKIEQRALNVKAISNSKTLASNVAISE